jgi:hypothetical protein
MKISLVLTLNGGVKVEAIDVSFKSGFAHVTEAKWEYGVSLSAEELERLNSLWSKEIDEYFKSSIVKELAPEKREAMHGN